MTTFYTNHFQNTKAIGVIIIAAAPPHSTKVRDELCARKKWFGNRDRRIEIEDLYKANLPAFMIKRKHPGADPGGPWGHDPPKALKV